MGRVDRISELRRKVLEHLDADFTISALRALVQAPSENPPGNERNAAEAAALILERIGIASQKLDVYPGRPDLVAVIKGSCGTPSLIFNGHIDTVPIGRREDWSVDPFGAEVRNGRVYGRGSTDMKSGLAAMIAVAKALRDSGTTLAGDLLLQFAVGEENAEAGTTHLLEKGYRADYGVVTEPTDLKIATAQRGVLWCRATVLGKSTHASVAHVGVNAITGAGKVIEGLEKINERLQSKTHSLVPSPSVVATMLAGGFKENVVPERCEITMDRRLIPGETLEDALAEIDELLRQVQTQVSGMQYTVQKLSGMRPSETATDTTIAKVMRANMERLAGTKLQPWGTPYTSDVNYLILDGGVEAVTFGPGRVEECHCIDESVEIDQVIKAAQVLAATAVDLLAAPSTSYQ